MISQLQLLQSLAFRMFILFRNIKQHFNKKQNFSLLIPYSGARFFILPFSLAFGRP